jgi:CRISPR-associated endonuclease Csn1
VVPQKQVSPSAAQGFVNSGNNHHLAVYEREDGSLFDVMVSFQEAFERKANRIPLYLNEYEGGKLKWKFEQNDLFEIADEEGKISYYRIQKIAQFDVWFRLISETEINDSKDAAKLKLFYRITSLGALAKLNPISKRLSILNELM